MAPNHNLHFKNFFIKANVLTEQDFTYISAFATFSLEMPSNINKYVKITIKTTDIIPFEIYEKLIKEHANLKVIIVGTKPVDNLVEIDKYIAFFAEKNSFLDQNIFNLLTKSNYYFSQDGKIMTIKYFTSNELNSLKNNVNKLLHFLKINNFNLEKIDFVLDQVKQQKSINFKIEQEKKIEGIKIALRSVTANTLDKYENSNKVSGNFVAMKQLTSEMTEANQIVNLQGEIFDLEIKQTKNNGKIYYFSLYDHDDGAITLSYFLNHHGAFPFSSKTNKMIFINEPYLISFKIGDWVKVQCKLEATKYTNYQIFGRIIKICHGKKPSFLMIVDNEPKKRVELLCHSKMTSFDGISSVSDIFQYAKQLGHQSLGIIERFNVQSIPEIVEEAKKTKIKPIFGCEFEIIPKKTNLVINPCKNKLINSATYIIFDIETTGLNNEFDELIEFGAVKYKDGTIVDQIDFFCKPNKLLTPKIINLTHITNEMVANGCSQKEAIIKIREWVKDDILIAHNGISFDFAFLNKICEKNSLPIFSNCLIDTMQISRAINEALDSHRLQKVTRKYKIDYNELEAHRANKDSQYLLYVWQAMIKQLEEKKIKYIDEINNLQTNSLISSQHGYFVDVYIKAQTGVKALYQLVSLSLTKQLYQKNDQLDDKKTKVIGKPKLYFDDLLKYKDDLIICPHPTEGEIWQSVMNDTKKELIDKIKKYDYIFLSPYKHLEHEIIREEIKTNDIILAQKKIIHLCQQINKKICAVSDSYYLTKDEGKIHEIYLYVKQLGGNRHRLFSYRDRVIEPDQHYLTTTEMLQAFNYINDEKLLKEIVIENPINLVNSCQENIFPLHQKPERPTIKNCAEKLISLIDENTKKIYGLTPPKVVSERIEKEKKSVIGQGFAVIYWIAHLLVKKSNDDGYLVGSRGSVGSSFLAYLANISEVNPLPSHYLCQHCHHFEIFPQKNNLIDGFDLPPKKCPCCGKEMVSDGHNIPFEVFLGFKPGDKTPDIDLNFSGDYQATAHNFIKGLFGDMHAFRAGTIATVAAKTAYGYVKNYFEEVRSDFQPTNALIKYYSKRCEGVKRTTGQHPGGIVIVPKQFDVCDFTPYNYPSNDKSKNWYTTHFAFQTIHDTLLKFDILGHDEPTILNYLFKLTGINPLTIPNFDTKVISLFSNSKSLNIIDENYDVNKIATIGLPEFGTEISRDIIAETKPQCIGDLIKISGLSHGTNVWKGNAQEWINKAKKTIQDVISCREDILSSLVQWGVKFEVAFLATETIRKGKGIKPEDEEIFKQCNVPAWFIQSCKLIKYLFPKAHATAYVLDAIRTAWYKVYYPREFYAVYFTVRTKENFDLPTIIGGKESVEKVYNDYCSRRKVRGINALKNKEINLIPIFEICLEMFARGIFLKNVDLNKSDLNNFTIDNGAILPPFTAIDGLGIEVAKSIVLARKDKPFVSIHDLQKRTKINSAILTKLKQLHILDNLSEDQQMNLF